MSNVRDVSGRVTINGEALVAKNDADYFDAPNNKSALFLKELTLTPAEAAEVAKALKKGVGDGRDKVLVEFEQKASNGTPRYALVYADDFSNAKKLAVDGPIVLDGQRGKVLAIDTADEEVRGYSGVVGSVFAGLASAAAVVGGGLLLAAPEPVISKTAGGAMIAAGVGGVGLSYAGVRKSLAMTKADAGRSPFIEGLREPQAGGGTRPSAGASMGSSGIAGTRPTSGGVTGGTSSSSQTPKSTQPTKTASAPVTTAAGGAPGADLASTSSANGLSPTAPAPLSPPAASPSSPSPSGGGGPAPSAGTKGSKPQSVPSTPTVPISTGGAPGSSGGATSAANPVVPKTAVAPSAGSAGTRPGR